MLKNPLFFHPQHISKRVSNVVDFPSNPFFNKALRCGAGCGLALSAAGAVLLGWDGPAMAAGGGGANHPNWWRGTNENTTTSNSPWNSHGSGKKHPELGIRNMVFHGAIVHFHVISREWDMMAVA